MKSVIISTAYPLRGGIAQSNEGLSRAMNKAGIKNHIISFKFLYPSFFFPDKSFKEVGKGPTDLKISSEISSINPLTWFSVASKVKKEKPDFVVVRYWVPFLSPALGTISRLIKLNTKIKVICLVDQVYPHERRFVDDILAGYTLGSGDAFIVFSKSVEKKLIYFAKGKKIVQTPLPLYTAFGKKISKLNAKKRLGLQKDSRVLLFFGFIRHYKGLDLLIKALAEPKVRRLGIKLLVVGEFFEDSKPYHDLVSKLGLTNIVFKSEYVPNEDVKYYFCASDLVMQPYRSASQSAVTPVAYHFERPMLVTNVGGLAEPVPDGVVGYVTKPSSQEIAAAIADFYQNKRESAFEKGIRKEKKKLEWSVFVKKLNGLVKSI